MSSDKPSKSLPAGARGPGGGRGPMSTNKKNGTSAPENSNGVVDESGQSDQSNGAGAPYVTQGRRKGKRNASGNSKTGLTPKAKAKFSGQYLNGARVPLSAEEELAAKEATEAQEAQRKKAVALRPKIRGLSKKKQQQRDNAGNHAGKLPSNKNSQTNSKSAEGRASQDAGNVAGTASQSLQKPGPSGQPNSKNLAKKAVPKETTSRRPTGEAGVVPTTKETNPKLTIIITENHAETVAEAQARLDRERRSTTQPPTTEREVQIAAELLEIQSLKDSDEQAAPKRPSYAMKVRESNEGIHSVLYLYSGVKSRIDLPEETFNQVIAAIEDRFMTLAMEKIAFAKWKWFSWSENRGLIAVASEEDSNQFINMIKTIRIPGSEQTFKLWKISDFEERHLVTVTISNGLARLGETKLIDSLMFQNSLTGMASRARVELDKNGKDWTLKFFADKDMWWMLLQLRGEVQGRKLWLDLGGGEVLTHLSRDPGVAIKEAEDRALVKAKASVAKAKARAEAKAARDGDPSAPNATGTPKEEPIEDNPEGGTAAMEHSGNGAGNGGGTL
jgi:hypothetical protein